MVVSTTTMIMRFVMLMLLLCAPLVGQTARLANYSQHHFAGWKRITVDAKLPYQAGAGVGGIQYRLGRPIGEDAYVVDVYASLAPGQKVEYNLGKFAQIDYSPPLLPLDIVEVVGGMPIVNGVVMPLVGINLADGAGVDAHFRARINRALVVDLWLTWYPSQPYACQGEALVTCSNPGVADLVERVDSIDLKFGDAVVLPFGGQTGKLVSTSTTFADGQARAIPLSFIWYRHIKDIAQFSTAAAMTAFGVGGVGINRLLPGGNPRYPTGFDPIQWAGQKMPESIRRIHTWDVGAVGPNKVSGDTGAQEDQIFVRGESLLHGGQGAELIAYLGALKMANRPCHHRELDGGMLDYNGHKSPRLLLWDGRPHWSASVSPDRLGKQGDLSIAAANGWWGPDVEHWLINTLTAAVRLTGSPCCQYLLANHAAIYHFQWTSQPGISTSQTYAARAVGYEAMNVVAMWENLEDRSLAASVKSRWIERFNLVIRPAYAGKSIYDLRFNDPRLGQGWWWLPWQQSVAAYGLYLAGEKFKITDATAIALRGANEVVNDGIYYDHSQLRWKCYSALSIDGQYNNDNIFWLFGTPLAPAVVNALTPGVPKAVASWLQMLTDAVQMNQTAWLVPR